MKLQLLLATAAVLAAPAMMPASAQQSNVYVSGGYTNFDAGNADLGAVQARVGVEFTQNFAVEGEAAVGVNDDNGAELDNEFGIYAVGKLPISSQIDVFGRVGASRTEASGGYEQDGLAYGAGAQFNLTGADGIRADWTRHDYDPGEIDAWSLSYVRKF